jgi:hypothetical protein
VSHSEQYVHPATDGTGVIVLTTATRNRDSLDLIAFIVHIIRFYGSKGLTHKVRGVDDSFLTERLNLLLSYGMFIVFEQKIPALYYTAPATAGQAMPN